LAALLEAELEAGPSKSAPRKYELSLVFCDDPFIQALNRDYRAKDSPTDVLSFPQDLQFGVLGDIVISVPTARRQAEAGGRTLREEVEWLFLHGALHLLGYEDETDAQAEVMNRKARRVQERLRQEAAPAAVSS
jgi:probable rRNA maturation factor